MKNPITLKIAALMHQIECESAITDVRHGNLELRLSDDTARHYGFT